jgi:glycosyltransferase involved in cell wall biosynthesis
VGYSGNLGRAHEWETMLDAAERLRDHEDVVFLFIGGGALMERLRAEAAVRGLSSVIFESYQPAERLPYSLPLPDVHLVVLHPELEGLILPSKFYAIAAAGRPVLYVGSEGGEIPRLLAGVQAGLTVPPGDGEGLARAILLLRGDPALRERMGESARALSEARFSRRAALLQWETLLETAVGTVVAARD